MSDGIRLLALTELLSCMGSIGKILQTIHQIAVHVINHSDPLMLDNVRLFDLLKCQFYKNYTPVHFIMMVF